MNNASQSLRVGLFFIIGVALIWIVSETLGGRSLSQPSGYTLTARFENVKQLKPGDEVRMSGVRIGEVVETTLNKGVAITRLSIDKSFEIPAQSIATITSAGLLGNNYVSIAYQESESMLKDGAQIQTKETADIGEVIAKIGEVGERVDNLLQGFEGSMGIGEQAGGPGELFTNLNSLVTENRENLTETITNLRTVSERLAAGEGTLGKLMTDDEAYNKMISMTEELNMLVTDTRGIIDDVQQGKGTLGMLLYDEQVAETMRRSMLNVEEFTASLNNPNSTLGKLIGSDDLYLQAQGTLRKVNSAVDSVNDSGPITAVGVASNALF